MSHIPLKYKKLFLLGLLLQIITAYFSLGHNNHDEHFQILEFCNYKLGLSPASDLPWEFAEQLRPALQPFIAFCYAKVLYAVGAYDPFTLTFLLRLSIGIFSWWVTCRIIVQVQDEFCTEKGKLLFAYAAFFIWWGSYLTVRFSSENLSATLFLLAVSFLLQLRNGQDKKRTLYLIAIGLVLGFSLVARLQIIFAFAGLGIWLLFIQKWKYRELFIITLSLAASVALCTLIDHWFYEKWIFTPYNYYYANIVKHVAASFGVQPWWWYFTEFFVAAVPPLSILLMILFFTGVRKRPVHVLSLSCILFIAGHCFISHKELRFMFPLALPFMFLACIGLDVLYQKYPMSKILNISINTVVAVNIGLLAYRAFAPAQDAVPCYRYIYRHINEHDNTLVSFNKDPYQLELRINFYRPKGNIIVLRDTHQLDSFFVATNAKTVLFLDYSAFPTISLPGYKLEKKYSLMPGWLLHFNFNNWAARSKIWTIYELSPANKQTITFLRTRVSIKRT
jgi:phosphatidylinositol glycan class B